MFPLLPITPMVRITHLLTMLHLRMDMDTMGAVTIDPAIMAITDLDPVVTTGGEDMAVTMVVMDIIGNEVVL